MEPEWKVIRHEMLAVVAKSATSASVNGRTVSDPNKVAEYVVNALTVHHLDLLARAAVEYAEEQVRVLLNDGGEGGG